jgi:RNA polymerase sigma factor (sigma-70 family)
MGKGVDNDYWPIIWNRFKSGDKEAFAVLYNQHIDRLYHYGTKLCCDEEAVKDALQELFLELFMKRDKIGVTAEHLKYWLLLALKRNLIKKLQDKRKISHEFNESVDFETEYSIEFQIIETENDAETNRKVLYAISQLPNKQKEAIYLRFNESLEYGEIAVILKITIESVRKQIYRALKTIREIIGNDSYKIYFTLMLKKG